MEEHRLRAGEEWGGQKSSKFLPNKKHINFEPTIDPTYKQMFDSNGRKHLTQPACQEKDFKPSVKQINFDANHEVKRPSQKAMVPGIISEAKARPQRRHAEEKISGTYEDDEVGKKTYVYHNRKTMSEYMTTDLMGHKKRTDFYGQRNGIGVASLGDKKYKAVEYDDRFFHEGGLVVGSTHQIKIKSAGNAKAIDFYSGLKLDGPLNKDRVKWSDRVKQEEKG